jgi:hypothetical protein
MADGSVRQIKDVQVGDHVVSLADDGLHTTVGKVTWKSDRYSNPCVTVRTLRGHDAALGVCHPVRQLECWTPAGRLGVGDRVASVGRVGRPSTDLCWDTVVSTEAVGDQWCYDLTVEGTSSFVAGGLVTHNSTTLSAISNTLVVVLNLAWQYVSATMEQAKEYSQWKLDNPIRDSKILSGLYDMAGQQRPFNIKRKETFLGGRHLVGTAYGDASRIRGNPADALSVDEISLVDIDTIQVLRECLFNSELQFELHSGTPLSTDNPQWQMWDEQSVQHEWLVPCDCHTPRHWNLLGPTNIGLNGLICDKCGKMIDTTAGQWTTTHAADKAVYHAYRLPQIATPMAKYGEIVKKFSDHPIVTLRESFALAVEAAKDVLSPALIETRLCNPDLRLDESVWASKSAIYPTCAGIDWAQGGDAATVLTLGGYLSPDVFSWFGGFRFIGDPDKDLEMIIRILDRANVHRIVADWGAGYMRNGVLMRKYGYPRFMECEYHRQNDRLVLNSSSNRLQVDRNSMLDDMVTALRMKPHMFALPNRQDMERTHWFQDLRSVLVETDHLGRSQYVKRSGHTDDFFHSMFYCLLASYFIHPRLDIFVPIIVKSDEEGV